jgi:hypothetical protein
MPKGDNAKKGPMGGVIGGGRTPKALQLQNYEKGLKLLDDNIEAALNVLIDGLTATKTIYNKEGNIVEKDVPDNYFRFNCACVLVKKVFPDKKSKEISGPGGQPLPPSTVIDRRKVTMNVINVLDELDIDDIKKAQEQGDFKLLKKDLDYYLDEDAEEEIEEANAKVSEAIASTVGSEEAEVEAEKD